MSFRLFALALAAGVLMGASGARATPCDGPADPGFFTYARNGDCVVFDTTADQFEIEGWFHRDSGDVNHIFTESFFLAVDDEVFDVGGFELVGTETDEAMRFFYRRTFGDAFIMTVGLSFLLGSFEIGGVPVSVLDELVGLSIEPLRGDVAPPTVALFTYTDFDLDQTPDDDVTIESDEPFYAQIDGAGRALAVIGDPFDEATMTPPLAFEVRRCNAASGQECELLAGLQDGTLGGLNGFVDTDGDLTHAMMHLIPIDEGGNGEAVRLRKLLVALPVVEPATLGMLALGLAGMAWSRRRIH
jgi:hypothetical protein